MLRLFASEAVTSRRFLLFARVAEMEGLTEVAQVFRELADIENGFADGHLDFLRQVGDPISGMALGETSHNLESAARTLREEGEVTYPQVVRTAKSEGFPAIASWLETVVHTKRAHLDRFSAQEDQEADQ
jgi:rubrerythrin